MESHKYARTASSGPPSPVAAQEADALGSASPMALERFRSSSTDTTSNSVIHRARSPEVRHRAWNHLRTGAGTPSSAVAVRDPAQSIESGRTSVTCTQQADEQAFRADAFRRWVRPQEVTHGTTLLLVVLGAVGQLVTVASGEVGAYPHHGGLALACASSALSLALFSALWWRTRRAKAVLANEITKHAGKVQPGLKIDFNSLSALQCSAYGLSFVAALARSAWLCHPDVEGFERMTDCNGFQYNVFPAGFLVFYFMFPHLLVLVYRPLHRHAVVLLASVFWALPTVVGGLLPVRFGFGWGAMVGLAFVMGLNAFLAAYVSQFLAVRDRLSFLRACLLQEAVVVVRKEGRRAVAAAEAEAEQRARSTAMGKVVGFLSHQLRNPLHSAANMVGGAIDTLNRAAEPAGIAAVAGAGAHDAAAAPWPEPSGAANDLQVALNAILRLNHLVDDAVGLSEVSSLSEIEYTAVDVRSWIVAQVARAWFPRKSPSVIDVEPDVPQTVLMDARITARVMRSVLVHAMERETRFPGECGVRVRWKGTPPSMRIRHARGEPLPSAMVPCLIVEVFTAKASEADRLSVERFEGFFETVTVPLCQVLTASVTGSVDLCNDTVDPDSSEWRCVVTFGTKGEAIEERRRSNFSVTSDLWSPRAGSRSRRSDSVSSPASSATGQAANVVRHSSAPVTGSSRSVVDVDATCTTIDVESGRTGDRAVDNLVRAHRVVQTSSPMASARAPTRRMPEPRARGRLPSIEKREAAVVSPHHGGSATTSPTVFIGDSRRGSAHSADLGAAVDGLLRDAASRFTTSLTWRPLGLHCLVVEDELINRKVLERMLARIHCTCDMQHDGADIDIAGMVTRQSSPPRSGAVPAARRPYDAILTDIVMPRVDGEQLLSRLRKAGITAPCIACTSNCSEDDIQRYARIGFNAVLCKPFSVSALYDVLEPIAAAQAVPGAMGGL